MECLKKLCKYICYTLFQVLDIKNTQKTLTTKQNDDDDSSGIESESDNEEDEEVFELHNEMRITRKILRDVNTQILFWFLIMNFIGKRRLYR